MRERNNVILNKMGEHIKVRTQSVNSTGEYVKLSKSIEEIRSKEMVNLKG